MDIDFAALREPIAEAGEAADGPDLSDDAGFASFEADVEGFMPTRGDDYHFGFRKPNPDVPAFMERCLGLLERSRDIRLMVTLAKLCALSGRTADAGACLMIVRDWLQDRWDTVHPQAFGGSFALRAVTIERFDEFASFVLPLQYAPIIVDRVGNVSYRDHAVAAGEVNAREGDAHPSLSDIERVLNRCEMETLLAARDLTAGMDEALNEIALSWSAQCDDPSSLTFTRLAPVLPKMAAFLEAAVAARDPSLARTQTEEDEAEPAEDDGGEGAAGPAPTAKSIAGIADAKAALAAASGYFEQHEPSSPALLLIKKATGLVGLTFPQVLQQIAPNEVYNTEIPLPGRKRIALSMEKLSEEFEYLEIAAPDDDGEVQEYAAPNRAAANALLTDVSRWYRTTEPSSPIPLLLDKARELSAKEFSALLSELAIPEASS